jgi:glycosyltransferase involved in cell wall biosynthesis
MTRIVFYNHTGQVSGAEKMLLVGLEQLPAELFECVLVCPEEGPLQGAASSLGVAVFPSRAIQARFTYNPVKLLAYGLSMLGALGTLRKTLGKLQPDVIHANTVRAGIVATAATSGSKTPIVWHNHDILPSHPLTAMVRWFAHSSKRIRVIGCSAASAHSLRAVGNADEIPLVIPNGTRIVPGGINESARNAKRRELGVSLEQVTVGIVGQLTPRKGQLELIQAFAQVKAKLSSAVLILCGKPIFNNDDEYLALLHREVDRFGLAESVHFLGQRQDASEVIGALDICVLNSKTEPFGLTLIEAMAMGTAVVATDCGGPSEIVRHGVDGEIVGVGDRDALISAIVRLGNDAGLRQAYAASASERVGREYSLERYIARWCGVYQDMVHPMRAGAQHPVAGEPDLRLQARGQR